MWPATPISELQSERHMAQLSFDAGGPPAEQASMDSASSAPLRTQGGSSGERHRIPTPYGASAPRPGGEHIRFVRRSVSELSTALSPLRSASPSHQPMAA